MEELARSAKADAHAGPCTAYSSARSDCHSGVLVLGRNRDVITRSELAFRISLETSAEDAVATALDFFSTSRSGFGFNCRTQAMLTCCKELPDASGMTIAYTGSSGA